MPHAMLIPLTFLAATVGAPAIAQPTSIAGNWRTEDGKAVVRIAPCGNAMCGRIVRLLTPQPPEGAQDVNNPEPSRRSRGLLGLRVFWALAPTGERYEGEGYSPARGRYFDAQVWRDGDRLRVKGCVKFVCQTQTLIPG